jgi:hypothetical protein
MTQTAYFEPDVDTKTYTTYPFPRVPPSPYTHLNLDALNPLGQPLPICPAADNSVYSVFGFPGEQDRRAALG